MSATNSAIEVEQVLAFDSSHTPTRASNTNTITRTSGYTEIIVEQRDRIFIITFNRPAVRNALTRRGYYELLRALSDARFNNAITTIVLTGANGCFTAGNDMTQTLDYTNLNAFFRNSNMVLCYLIRAFMNCSKVLLALVDGPCIGIGFVLVALCDVVYCTERAYFEAPFTKWGLCAEGCLSYLLPQIIGRVKAAELLLFGTRLSAEDALSANFVVRIIPSALMECELWPQLQEYSRLPAESLRATKRLLNKAEYKNIENAFRAECAELVQLRVGPTYRGALKAFIAHKGSGGGNKSKL